MTSFDKPTRFWDDETNTTDVQSPVSTPIDATSGFAIYLRGLSLYGRIYDAAGLGAESAAIWTSPSGAFAWLQALALRNNLCVALPAAGVTTDHHVYVQTIWEAAGALSHSAVVAVDTGITVDTVQSIRIDDNTALVVVSNHNTWYSNLASSTLTNESDVTQKYFVVHVDPVTNVPTCSAPAVMPAKYLMVSGGSATHVLGYHFGYHAPGPTGAATADFNGVVETLHLAADVLTATGLTTTLTGADAAAGAVNNDLLWMNQSNQFSARWADGNGVDTTIGLIEDQTSVPARLRAYRVSIASDGTPTFAGYSGFLDERSYFNFNWYGPPRIDYQAGAWRVAYNENWSPNTGLAGSIAITVHDPIGGDWTDADAPNVPVLLELDATATVVDRITAAYADIAAVAPYAGVGLTNGESNSEPFAPAITSAGEVGVAVYNQLKWDGSASGSYYEWDFVPLAVPPPPAPSGPEEFGVVIECRAEVRLHCSASLDGT